MDVVSFDFDAVCCCFLWTELAGFWLSKWVMRLLQSEKPVDMLEGMAAVQAGLNRLGNWDDKKLAMFHMGILVDDRLNVMQ